MVYKIEKSVVVYKDGKPSEVFVLWDDNGFSRATYASLNPSFGYTSISASEGITEALIQRVAGEGYYCSEEQKKEHFPTVKKWSR